MDGKAIRKQIKVTFDSLADSVYMDILMYIPKYPAGRNPVIVGLNFGGNQEVKLPILPLELPTAGFQKKPREL